MSKKSKTHLGILFFFFIVSIFYLWPLPIYMGSKVIGPSIGDNLEYVWKLWWIEHAILEKGVSPWFIGDVFFPYGFGLATGAVTPLHTFGGILLTKLVGAIATYNLFVFLSFVFGGFFAYLYVWRLTGSLPGGVLTGIIFAFSPYHYTRAAGQFNVVAVQWIPLYFLSLDIFLENRKQKDAFLTGLVYSLNALSSWYYGAILMVVTPVYAAFKIFRDPNRKIIKQYLKGAAVFVGVSLVLILPFLAPNLAIQQRGESQVPLEMVSFWSASFVDYLTPSMTHFLWGDWVVQKVLPYHFEILEFNLTWGLIATIFALYGWRFSESIWKKRWGYMIALAFVLSLGPALKVFTHLISFSTQSGLGLWLKQGIDWLGMHSFVGENFHLMEEGRLAIPLPAILLRWFVPGFASMRSWGRFSVIALLGVAVFAGVGLDRFLRVEKGLKHSGGIFGAGWKKTWSISLLIVTMVLLEFYPGTPLLVDAAPRAVDYWLADREERVTVIQMPVSVALNGAQLFYWGHHQQRLASAYGTYFPIMFRERFPELEMFPSDSALELLSSWGSDAGVDEIGVNYILVDELTLEVDDVLWDQIAKQPRLELVTKVGTVQVYRINSK